MLVVNAQEAKAKKINTFPYRGEQLEVKGVHIRWLSDVGLDENGSAEYGLRYFTVAAGGEIPIHKHFYSQTMYFLAGEFECESFNSEDDSTLEVCKVGVGDSVFVRSMEPHAMRNVGTTEGAFLCCICNVYESEAMI